jgi:hypothetical protein
VYDAGEGNTLHGYRYWMAHSPALAGGFTTEWMCLLVSNDGQTWFEPAGLTNPISGAIRPDTGILVEQDGTMWYTAALSACEGVVAISSSDGITWSAETSLVPTGANNSFTSPSVVHYDGLYRMFSVKFVDLNDNTKNIIEMRTCATMTGTWSAPVTCNLTLPTGFPWHLSVIVDGSTLWMALNVSAAWLMIARSTDGGANWIVDPLPALSRGDPGMWDWLIYSSCLVRTATGFRIWYSANDNGSPKTYRIGYTTAERR